MIGCFCFINPFEDEEALDMVFVSFFNPSLWLREFWSLPIGLMFKYFEWLFTPLLVSRTFSLLAETWTWLDFLYLAAPENCKSASNSLTFTGKTSSFSAFMSLPGDLATWDADLFSSVIETSTPWLDLIGTWAYFSMRDFDQVARLCFSFTL